MMRGLPENNLSSVTIPAGVTYIGDEAFSPNPLKTITIPPSVRRLGGNPLVWEDNSMPADVGTWDKWDHASGAVIVIGADVVITGENYDGFEHKAFKRDYDKNGRKAGRYTAVVNRGTGSTIWTYSAK